MGGKCVRPQCARHQISILFALEHARLGDLARQLKNDKMQASSSELKANKSIRGFSKLKCILRAMEQGALEVSKRASNFDWNLYCYQRLPPPIKPPRRPPP